MIKSTFIFQARYCFFMNTQKGFVLVLTSIFLILVGLMLKPFMGYLLGALILAFVMYPMHEKLEKRIGGHTSAFTLTILSVVVFLLPFVVILTTISGDISQVVTDITQNELVDIGNIETTVMELTGQEIDIRSELTDAANALGSTALGGVSQVLGAVTSISIGLSIMLFLVFYLLKDGKAFKEYTKDLMPLPEEIIDKLYSKTHVSTWAVIKGHVLVAVAQGSIAGVGVWIAGVPSPLFWTLVMIVLAFIPIVGSLLVWGPAGLYLIAIGNIEAGVFLLLYGAIVVNLTDNFLRPLVVDNGADLHPAVILIGVIGGVYLFGAVGLFIGPVVFGSLKAVLEVFKNNYNEL